MRILLTGATGFLGRNLLIALLKNDYEVITLVRSPDKISHLKNEISYFEVISTSNPDWKKAVELSKPEIVIHLAAYLSSDDSEATIKVLIDSNILFGTQLLDAIKNSRATGIY